MECGKSSSDGSTHVLLVIGNHLDALEINAEIEAVFREVVAVAVVCLRH